MSGYAKQAYAVKYSVLTLLLHAHLSLDGQL